MEISMMTGNSETTINESSSKLQRLQITFVFISEDELENEEDVTPLEELPKWTVRELEHSFVIQEGISVVESALARRFSDPFRAYVLEEVAVELQMLEPD
jgi:hypothetical protein